MSASWLGIGPRGSVVAGWDEENFNRQIVKVEMETKKTARPFAE